MKSLHRVAFIGNSLPRRCGIATFTAGTWGPGFRLPKYFCTSARACRASKSPASTSVALLGR